jgi:2-polyprenyl-3-methyl-5-hydroxy-6-metoxy-1,4-benzoquinol methylase
MQNFARTAEKCCTQKKPMAEIQDIDPFEQAFLDYYQGDETAQVVVHNSKGDDEVMLVAYFFRSWADMPELERIALDACYGHVLDIGAGSGCHSIHLQNKGMTVTALDIRPGFVEVMKKRGLVNTILADIRKTGTERYDTLLMLMNGIGFTRNFEGLEKFLKKARNMLNPGGQVLLDSSDLLYLYREEDGTISLNLNEDYYGEVEYQVEYKGRKGKPFKWLFVDYSNLAFIADQAGFSIELMYEDDSFNYLARLY